MLFQNALSDLEKRSQDPTYQGIRKLPLLLLTLFFYTTYLQIFQETLEVKPSLLCIPVAIGPNVFKTSSGKHSIMVL